MVFRDKNNEVIYVGACVSVDPPRPNDLWIHEFDGVIKQFNVQDNSVIVEDGDGDCWDVDLDQIELQ